MENSQKRTEAAVLHLMKSKNHFPIAWPMRVSKSTKYLSISVSCLINIPMINEILFAASVRELINMSHTWTQPGAPGN